MHVLYNAYPVPSADCQGSVLPYKAVILGLITLKTDTGWKARHASYRNRKRLDTPFSGEQTAKVHFKMERFC